MEKRIKKDLLYEMVMEMFITGGEMGSNTFDGRTEEEMEWIKENWDTVVRILYNRFCNIIDNALETIFVEEKQKNE